MFPKCKKIDFKTKKEKRGGGITHDANHYLIMQTPRIMIITTSKSLKTETMHFLRFKHNLLSNSVAEKNLNPLDFPSHLNWISPSKICVAPYIDWVFGKYPAQSSISRFSSSEKLDKNYPQTKTI